MRRDHTSIGLRLRHPLLATLLAVMMLRPSSVVGQAPEPTGPPGDPQPAATESKPSPPLPENLVGEIARCEQAITNALSQFTQPDLLTNAIPKAEYVLKVRLAHQGEAWWETFNSRQQLADLRRLATMPAEQRTRLAEARRLLDQMFQFHRESKYSNALEVAQTACEIRGEILGREHPDYAVSLNYVAFCLNALPERQSEALAKYEAALATYRRVFTGDHPTIATFLNNVACCLDDLPGRIAEALPKYQAALEMQQRLFKGDHADVARSLNNVAACLDHLGRSSEALPKYEAALAMRQRLSKGDDEDVADSLNNLAFCLDALGRLSEALPKYEAALALRQRLSKGDDEDVADSLNNVAACLKELGRPAEALQTFETALAMYQRLFAGNHPKVARGLGNLAACLDDLGRSAEALPKYETALAMQQRLFKSDHSAVAASLNNTAYCLLALGRVSDALPRFEVALAMQQRLFKSDHPDVAQSLNNLGACLRTLRRLPEALQQFEAALAMQRRLFKSDHPDVARSLNNVATCLQGLGLAAEAAEKYEAALAMRRRLYAADHPAVARSLNDLAGLKAAMGQREAASRLLLESAQVQWRHLTRNFPTLSARQKRQFLAPAGFDQGERLSSLVFRDHGVEGNVGLQGALLSKQLLFEAARQESGALLAATAGAPADWQVKWQAHEQLRRRYATLAMRGLSEADLQQQGASPKVDPAYVRLLAGRIEQLEQQLREGNPAYAQAARLQQVSVEDVAAALHPGEALIEYVHYRSYDFATNQWGTAHYGAFILPGDGGPIAAIDLGDAKTIDKAVQRFRSEMDKAILPFKNGVQPSRAQLRRSEEQIALASSALRERVWKPMEARLSGVRRVYVAPDGLLGLVPFEALAQADGSSRWRYLAEERELVYLSTGRDLARLALSAPADRVHANTAVLIGNPAFSAEPEQLASVVAGLRPAAPIIAQVAERTGAATLGSVTTAQGRRLHVPRDWRRDPALDRLIGQAQGQLTQLGWSVSTLTNELAVEEAALRVESPRILQFATHGYLLGRPDPETEGWDNPLLRSMLLLAGVNRWQPEKSVFYRASDELLTLDRARARGLSETQMQNSRMELADGILTAYEVTGMNLRGTELVNLTACETGLGEVTPDGVAGLRQAFLLAGARSLTMSLWEVPAAETTQQVADFYGRWLGGSKDAKTTTRYVAFRAAQLAALAHARQTHGAGHPFYWAGVVYVGDPADLPNVPMKLQQK
jgi:tetratricopeptide (TPR) repeat protein